MHDASMKLIAFVVLVSIACKSEKTPPSQPPATPPPMETSPTPAAPAPPPPVDAPPATQTGVAQCRFVELAAATELLGTPTRFIANVDRPDMPCRIGTSDKSDREITMDLSGVYSADVITGEMVPGVGEKAGWEKAFATTPEEVDPALFFQVKGKIHRVRVTGARTETLEDETIAWAKYLARRMTEIE